MAAPVRLPGVHRAATAGSARDDTADRAGASWMGTRWPASRSDARDAGDARLQALRHRVERERGRSLGLFASGATSVGPNRLDRATQWTWMFDGLCSGAVPDTGSALDGRVLDTANATVASPPLPGLPPRRQDERGPDLAGGSVWAECQRLGSNRYHENTKANESSTLESSCKVPFSRVPFALQPVRRRKVTTEPSVSP